MFKSLIKDKVIQVDPQAEVQNRTVQLAKNQTT